MPSRRKKSSMRFSRPKRFGSRSVHIDRSCPDGDVYKLFKKRLGCGTFGCAYEASTSAMRTKVSKMFGTSDVVFKVIYDNEGEVAPTQQFAIAKRMDSLGIGARIYSPKLLKCYDANQDVRRWGYVMQKLGKSVAQYLDEYARKHKVKRSEARKTLRPLWSSMKKRFSKMEKAGWSHNDIHEGNVLLELDSNGVAIDSYLIDFDRAEHYTNVNSAKFQRQLDKDYAELRDMFDIE